MKTIAVITARGGSKRIPRKNIKEFCGKPIVAYSIEAAEKCYFFDEIMVSTDDETIASVSKQYGANVPFLRSKENSNDTSTTVDVLLEVLNEYSKNGKIFDAVCCIYPTAPFVTSSKLTEAYELLNNGGISSVIPVVKYSFPPQRGLIIENNNIKYKNPEFEKVRSQDLEPIYHDCGQFYFIKVNDLFMYKSLIVPNTKPVIFDETEVQDIDNLSDWQLAELKYTLLTNNQKSK